MKKKFLDSTYDIKIDSFNDLTKKVLTDAKKGKHTIRTKKKQNQAKAA